MDYLSPVTRISDLASDSDFTMFLQTQGISCSSTSYVCTLTADSDEFNRGTCRDNVLSFILCMQGDHTPVYHTVHDNFYWMQHFGDPGFSRHLASGLVWAKTGILLATTPVLPYDPRDYSIALNRIYNGLVQQYAIVLQQQNITLGEVVSGL